LPDLVRRPRRCYSPEECSEGTRPRKLISSRAAPKPRKSPISASSPSAVSVAMPRKQHGPVHRVCPRVVLGDPVELVVDRGDLGVDRL
jgi:hypothetical protein